MKITAHGKEGLAGLKSILTHCPATKPGLFRIELAAISIASVATLLADFKGMTLEGTRGGVALVDAALGAAHRLVADLEKLRMELEE